MSQGFNHFDENGNAVMVDVSGKNVTYRTAVATGEIHVGEAIMAAIMQEELTPIRERRKEFEKDIPAIYDMLRKGCETARATATATLDEVRKAMKINYFDDVELNAEQAKRFGQE